MGGGGDKSFMTNHSFRKLFCYVQAKCLSKIKFADYHLVSEICQNWSMVVDKWGNMEGKGRKGF